MPRQARTNLLTEDLPGKIARCMMSVIHRTPRAMVVRITELRNCLVQEETPAVKPNDDIGAFEFVDQDPRIRIFPRSNMRWPTHADDGLTNIERAPGVKTNASIWNSRLMNVRLRSQAIVCLQESRMLTRHAVKNVAIRERQGHRRVGMGVHRCRVLY